MNNEQHISIRTLVGGIILSALVTYGVVAFFDRQEEPVAQVDRTPSSGIAEEYLGAGYRVLGVLNNPKGNDTLIIATERAESNCGTPDHPQRCMNDTMCGSRYSQPTCYFFLEPQYHYDADPETKFVAQWGGEALQIDTITFLDANTISFESAEGDAGAWAKSLWNLDLKTGTATLKKRESNYEEPHP